MIDLEQEARSISSLEERIRQLQASREAETEALTKAKSRQEHALAAQQVLQHLAQAVQQQAHERISRVVTTCLEAVFDDPYSFQIQFERKRGKTEARLRFVRGKLDLDPLTAAGGGLVDVASFALRIACLIMHRPRLSRVVVLDEPMKFVSEEYLPNVRSMLEQISKDMGIQIIMVSHINELEIGKVIRL